MGTRNGSWRHKRQFSQFHHNSSLYCLVFTSFCSSHWLSLNLRLGLENQDTCWGKGADVDTLQCKLSLYHMHCLISSSQPHSDIAAFSQFYRWCNYVLGSNEGGLMSMRLHRGSNKIRFLVPEKCSLYPATLMDSSFLHLSVFLVLSLYLPRLTVNQDLFFSPAL